MGQTYFLFNGRPRACTVLRRCPDGLIKVKAAIDVSNSWETSADRIFYVAEELIINPPKKYPFKEAT